MVPTPCPRLVIAGTAGDSGKTLVAMGLLAAWREQGLHPRAFKKGPDYIDPAWLGFAAGAPCRNLDTYLQPRDRLLAALSEHASSRVNVVEGNRGLLDGVDVAGTHSTAALAALIQAPVVLVVNARKVTRTVAAPVAGCQALAPEVRISGVVLNQVSGSRHERLARRAVEELAGVPVVGALPRLEGDLLPGRHLGLVPPEEHPRAGEIREQLAGLLRTHADLGQMLSLAEAAPPLEGVSPPQQPRARAVRARVGVFMDSAFTFYYPENLEALEEAGAELVRISGLEAVALPEVDALYLGGGFPETHAARLAARESLHAAVREAVEDGLPIYAECGGLIFLSRSLTCGGQRHSMAGVLPVDLELCARPQGHGYVEVEVDRPNRFFTRGMCFRGHEFHHTRISGDLSGVDTALQVRRGTGCGDGRDGIVYKNVFAGYTHIHALGVPEWASAMVDAAEDYRRNRERRRPPGSRFD
jgi:cobyrinic acid a,c-diamide synthase